MPRYKVPNLNLKTVKKTTNRYDKYGLSETIDVKVPLLPYLNTKVLSAVLDNGNKLEMSIWHVCKTTHCRAGWTIHVCGKQGYDLEKEIGDEEKTAELILRTNYPDKELPHFYANNDTGMECLLEDAKEDYENRTRKSY
jgi:hypothetical protein